LIQANALIDRVVSVLSANRKLRSVIPGLPVACPTIIGPNPGHFPCWAMMGVGLVAAWIPARQALAVDPMILLREE
jgi:hypothetical protein